MSPAHRFHDAPGYGYARLGYRCMRVLVASRPKDCGIIEQAMIAEFRERAGCKNIRGGDDHRPPPHCPGFLYAVGGYAGEID